MAITSSSLADGCAGRCTPATRTRVSTGRLTFPSLNAYQITQIGLQQGLTPAQIRALGGGASQFSLVAGQPLSDVSMIDVGLYAEDEWRIRPNISLSYGLRYETQTGIPYEGDWAPRMSLAWGLGHCKTAPKTVLRGGYGIFYDRFSYDYLLQAERLNGITQQQYIVTQPNFYPLIPSPGAAEHAGDKLAHDLPGCIPICAYPTRWKRRSAWSGKSRRMRPVSVTYLNSRGEHQLFLRNANAPLPGTYNPADPTSGIRPFGGTTNIYQYNSGGSFRAEPTDRQRPGQRWNQALAVWLLFAQLRQ